MNFGKVSSINTKTVGNVRFKKSIRLGKGTSEKRFEIAIDCWHHGHNHTHEAPTSKTKSRKRKLLATNTSFAAYKY